MLGLVVVVVRRVDRPGSKEPPVDGLTTKKNRCLPEALLATLPAVRRHDLTDAQWAVLEPLLPPVSRIGRPPTRCVRELIDGIRWRVRAGCPWRDVPACYGPWQSVYGLFRRWQRAGVWARVVTGLQTIADQSGLICWDVSVDSTIARAHQHAAGACSRHAQQAEPPAAAGEAEPADHDLGRSRGGWTTKLHLAVEQGQRVLALLATGGQRGDSPS
jgi:transposase